jgi:hypothetical protein
MHLITFGLPARPFGRVLLCKPRSDQPWVTSCLSTPRSIFDKLTVVQIVNKPLAFWHPKVSYCIPNSIPPVPIHSQINPAHFHISLSSTLILPSHSHLRLFGWHISDFPPWRWQLQCLPKGRAILNVWRGISANASTVKQTVLLICVHNAQDPIPGPVLGHPDLRIFLSFPQSR